MKYCLIFLVFQLNTYTFDLNFNSICHEPFNLSTFQPFNLSTFQPFNLSTFRKILLIFICFYTHESNAQALSISLAPSNYNGYNVSCFGGRDGAIVLTVSGGLTPYTYTWSNGSTTKDISNVAAGFYHILVQDQNLNGIEAVITLTEPEQMSLDFLVSTYPNGYNISCNNCYNGSILNLPQGGIPPYTYSWEDGASTQDRFNLGSGGYYLVVTDANQCYISPEQYYLSEPERSDWTMFGNSGSNPSSQFIGTTDNKDLVFKTNNSERLRLKANGVIKLNGLGGNGDKFLIANNSGEIIAAPCDPWMECGNTISSSNFIGSTNAVNVQFKVNSLVNTDPILTLKLSGKISIKEFENTSFGLLYTDNFGDIYKTDYTGNSQEFLDGNGNFSALPASASIWQLNGASAYYNNGNVGIGISNPAYKLEIVHTTPSNSNGISLINSSGSNKNSEIKFSDGNNQLWSIGNDVSHAGNRNFFIYDNQENAPWGKTRFLINAAGKIGIDTETPHEKLEVAHNDPSGGIALNKIDVTGSKSEIKFLHNGNPKYSIGTDINNNGGHNFFIWDPNPATGTISEKFYIDADGRVGIGVVPPTVWFDNLIPYKLYVADGIATRDIKVQANGWPDYVFDEEYTLLSIAELSNFIQKNKHLPGIPSASEIAKNEGYELGQMQILLLEKVEEQALFIIDLQKQINELKIILEKP